MEGNNAPPMINEAKTVPAPMMDHLAGVDPKDNLDTVEWAPMQTKSIEQLNISTRHQFLAICGTSKMMPRTVLVLATMFLVIISVCTVIFFHQEAVICNEMMPISETEPIAMPPYLSDSPGNKQTVFATIVVGELASSNPQDEICTSARSAMRQHPGVPFYVFHDGQHLSPQALHDIWACGLITAQIHPELRRLILEAASISLGLQGLLTSRDVRDVQIHRFLVLALWTYTQVSCWKNIFTAMCHPTPSKAAWHTN